MDKTRHIKEAGAFYVLKGPAQTEGAPGNQRGNSLKSPLASLVEEERWPASWLLPRIENRWSLWSFSSWISTSTACCQYNAVSFSALCHGGERPAWPPGSDGTLFAISATQSAPEGTAALTSAHRVQMSDGPSCREAIDCRPMSR